MKPSLLSANRMLYALIAILAMYLSWPYLWPDPVGHFVETVQIMSQHPWPGSVLFNGAVFWVLAKLSPWIRAATPEIVRDDNRWVVQSWAEDAERAYSRVTAGPYHDAALRGLDALEDFRAVEVRYRLDGAEEKRDLVLGRLIGRSGTEVRDWRVAPFTELVG